MIKSLSLGLFVEMAVYSWLAKRDDLDYLHVHTALINRRTIVLMTIIPLDIIVDACSVSDAVTIEFADVPV